RVVTSRSSVFDCSVHSSRHSCIFSFSFHATSPTEFYTLSLHDALPICVFVGICSSCRRLQESPGVGLGGEQFLYLATHARVRAIDRKSTRLNSSHVAISYAVFCLKKKKKEFIHNHMC